MLSSLMLSLVLAAPPAPFFELDWVEGAPRRMLTITREGAWTGGDATTAGQLAADELARLTAAIDKAVLTSERGPPCPARPGLNVLRTTRGEVRWSSGCGLVAHDSVCELVALAESLTTRRPHPIVVKLSRHRVGAPEGAETVALMRSGAWTTERGRGTLDASTLAKIIAAFDAALIEAPPIPDADVCRGDFPHHIEIPGRGEVRFIWPCHKPSESLQIALDALYAAVGKKSP